MGYPDILILPTLAKVLDISVNELLRTDHLKHESIEQYDYKIMTKYKLNIIFAFFILIFSPVLYIISAFVFQSYELSIISIFIGVIVALFSLITVILHSIQMYDFIRNKYTNEKYIRIFKNYLGLFSMILFVLSLFLAPLFIAIPSQATGAALVIAALAAEGITTIDDIKYIERGYEDFEKKLAQLGAQIEKVSTDKEIQKFTLKVS